MSASQVPSSTLSMQSRRGVVIVLIAAVIWSTTPVFIDHLQTVDRLSPFQLFTVSLRYLSALIASIFHTLEPVMTALLTFLLLGGTAFMDTTTPFTWRHFQAEMMLLCVRWYLHYPLLTSSPLSACNLSHNHLYCISQTRVQLKSEGASSEGDDRTR